MQTVKHPQSNIHPIFDEFDKLYAEFSDKVQKKTLVPNVYSDVFLPLIHLFGVYGWEGSLSTTSKHFITVENVVNADKRVIVCFSSGKDSIATVKHYLEKGYEVYLYHLKKINPPLYDECVQAKELADYFGVPIFIDDISLSGKHDYVEHPMKNMLIANGALQYGIREGITTNIAFGNYSTSTLQDDNFEFCGGDDIEMWEIYNKIISTVIPGFEMNIVLSNVAETLETVCPDKEVLDMSVSCLGRASMRNYWHDWVNTKFGINIPTHRCGRCYKCCLEYIYMTDHDLQEYSEEYYKYCFNNLKKNFQREDGKKYTDEEVWSHYMFYGIERSKCFG